MKKFLALLLALVMVFALAACGGTETTPTDTPDDSTVSEAPRLRPPRTAAKRPPSCPAAAATSST